ncbi:HDOD domain-containing protein [Thiomicrospira microaerophila]|uniref:HDOD domain-containing protein n=1 Tax=Thiomicrospira microaerophila TaxID=406020 RepID=UPI00201026E6|nr:HDOD domain-containing protein [Thiomicrospira microaerophila]
MSMEQVLRQAMMAIRGVKLPELPAELIALESELQSKFASSRSIAAIIEKNTTLSGEVLRVANSPAMKLKGECKTIADAVSNLGFNNIRNLVASVLLEKMFNSNQAYKDIMAHGVDVAFCMAELSEWVSDVSRDEAYMLGLFHNSGCLMFATKDADNYVKLFQSAHSQPHLILEKEEQMYGSHHAAVGVLLGKKWHLPVDMLSAILLHHNPECASINNDKVRALVAMIKVANSVVSEVSFGAYCGQEMKDYKQDGMQELMIDSDVVSDLRNGLIAFSNT